MNIIMAILIILLFAALGYPIVDWLHDVKGHSYFAIIVCSAPIWLGIIFALIISIRG